MNEKAFRLDFFIAIAALVVSVLSTLTLVYQTHVIGEQYAATIWPYLSVTTNLGDNEDHITVTNDGLGPALIRSAQLMVDGKAVGSWNDYFRILTSGLSSRPFTAHASLNSIGAATTIRPGASQNLFDLRYHSTALTPAVLAHHVELVFCYCSLNGGCWLLHASPGSNAPAANTPVHACTTSASIASYAAKPATSPSARPRRKSL